MIRLSCNRKLVLTIALLGLFLFALPVMAGDLPAYTPDANHRRDQVPDAYKWNLGPLFSSDATCDETMEQLRGKIPELASYKGKLNDPAALKNCLNLYFDLHDRTSHVQQYANLALNTELTNEAFQARKQRSLSLMDELMAAAGFIRGEVLAMDDDTMAKACADSNGPGEYKDYLDNLRRRRSRVLNPEAERVLAMAGDNLWAEIDLNEIPSPIETAFGAILSDISWPMVHDAEGKDVQLTLANYGRFRASSKREVRAEAVTDFFATLRQFQHAFAATLDGQFKLDVMYARARHYDTALEAYMDKDNLDTAVHDNLINTVNANLKPLHRYVELRKKVMGLADLHIYDLYVPMVAAAEMDVPFADAQRIITEALKPLGKDYGKLLKQGLDPKTGWLDLYPSNDKRSGAFSASVYGRSPYVFMNYQNSLDDMSTLAHEYGHALHSYLAMSNQPYHNYRYVAFLAEIASTCDEALLSDYLIAKAKNKDEKAGLLAAELESIRTTIYRQTLFSEFERMVHGYIEKGTPITASLLNQTYSDLIKRYYGPGFTVDKDDEMEWAYIPHFYYKYYVYSYATGLCSGIAIAERVKKMGDKAVEPYLGMLKGGCSDAPLELLRGAGVDLTKPDAIESALQRFDRRITELAKLLEVKI
ncbi:MAG: oligoendopeptidase F [Candidatus Latescibacterota bacterium]